MTEKQLIELNQILDAPITYKGVKVVPSQAYARFCGKETKNVNRAISRLEEGGRVIEGEDYFRLTGQMVTDCHHEGIQQLMDPRYGGILLTRRAVNTLAHYFDDENSVALSNRVNDMATDAMEEEDELDNDPFLRSLHRELELRKRVLASEKRLKYVEGIQREVLRAMEEMPRMVNTKLKESLPLYEGLNKFPKGCITLEEIRSKYFQGLNTDKISKYLKEIGHPTVDYSHTGDGHVHASEVFKEAGLREAWCTFLEQCVYVKETPNNIIVQHKYLGKCHINRRESDLMPSDFGPQDY